MDSQSGILLFISYKNERVSIDVQDTDSVKKLKEIVRETFSIGPDEGPAGIEGQEDKKLTLNCAGADLKDWWILTDIGIQSGTNVRAYLKEEVKPVLYISTVFNGQTVPILEMFHVPSYSVAELRGIVSRKTGIPVGVFRLLNQYNIEMYDCHILDKYGVDMGQVVRMETWDGWNDFLVAVMGGFTSHVMSKLSQDEITARYQLKVALYMAAHFGHVDLAVSLLRQGLRADEHVGEHPTRQWCYGVQVHIDSFKAPVHESAEAGQLGVLRSFVHNSICNVLAKDGIGLTPLNIALRKKQKPCASFLLTKQWSKVSYTKKSAIPLSIFVKMKRWSERSKERSLVVHGQWKSSLRGPKRQAINALVGQGVQLDGYSESLMTSRSMAEVKAGEEQEQRLMKQHHLQNDSEDISELNPDSYFRALSVIQTNKLPRLSRKSKLRHRTSSLEQGKNLSDRISEESSDTEEYHRRIASSPDKNLVHHSSSTSLADLVKFPAIKEEKEKDKHVKNTALQMAPPGRNLVYTKKRKTVFVQTGQGSQALPEKGNGKAPSPGKELSLPQTHPPSVAQKSNYPPGAPKSISSHPKSSKTTSLPSLSQSEGRPWIRVSDDDPAISTLRVYDNYRGLRQREYASRCLEVACNFKDKPWLEQVRQAVLIARKGVRKIVSGQPHLFTQPPATTRLASFSVNSPADSSTNISSLA